MAVHIETVEEIPTSSFKKAFRRFLVLWSWNSDRGSNFIGAAKEEMNTLKYIEVMPVQEFLQNTENT